MKAPWTTQLASDVIRDGLRFELVNEHDRVAAEVFRCDADHSVTVNVFENSLPEDVLDEFIEHARRRLGDFEDGTSLPEKFKVQLTDRGHR